MEHSPYYTLHLEIERVLPSSGHSFPKETELHHYHSSDEAFLLLFGVALPHLDRDTVVKNRLDYFIGNAFLTGPFADKPLASIKQVDRPSGGNGMTRYIVVDESPREIERQGILSILDGMGVFNVLDLQIPLAHYTKEGAIKEDCKPGIFLQPGRYNSLYSDNFILEVASHKQPLQDDPAHWGPATRSFTYSKSIRELFYHITQIDTGSFKMDDVAGREGGLTGKAVILGPYERDNMIEVYYASKGEHGIDRLGDAVFLQMEANERSIPVRQIPELLTLPTGRDGLNRVLAATERESRQLTETKAYREIRVQFGNGKIALALTRPRQPRFVRRTDGRLPLKP